MPNTSLPNTSLPNLVIQFAEFCDPVWQIRQTGIRQTGPNSFHVAIVISAFTRFSFFLRLFSMRRAFRLTLFSEDLLVLPLLVGPGFG